MIPQKSIRELINGDFDFAVEFEYDKSQFTEPEAIHNAINKINEELPPGLCARIADAEQCKIQKKEKVRMQMGFELFSEN